MTSDIFSALLNSTAKVLRATTSYNERREAERSWAEVAEIPVRLHTYRYIGSPSAYAEQGIVDLPSHKLFAASDADIMPGDQLEVSGRTYEVLEVYEPGGLVHHKEAWLKNV